MKIGIFYQTGLGTDPAGDCCGAKPFLLELAAKYATHFDLMLYAWNDPKSDAAYIDALNAYDVLLVAGHSHGAGEVVKKMERACSKVANCKIVAGIIDECPWAEILTPVLPPRDPPAVAKYGVAVWQRNMQPAGRAFKQGLHFIACDASFSTGRKLGHIDAFDMHSIAGDAVVWRMIEAALLAYIQESSASALAHDTARTPTDAPLPAPGLVVNATDGAGVGSDLGGGQ
jgi:hypothetical protein